MTRPTRRDVLAAGAVLSLSSALAGCSMRSNDEQEGSPATPPEGVEATTVVSGLEVPWELAFAGEDAFVTERDGGVRRFEAEVLATGADREPADAETVLAADALPDRAAPGEGGTLGVAAHPEYPSVPAVFVYYTVEVDGDLRNRIVRYDVETDDLEAILEGIPGSRLHNGGRIRFGPDGLLWALTGDAERPALAQDPASLAGATLRVTPDGEPAGDAFDEGDPRAYAIGHRNPQGIAFLPDGTPAVAEHGPRGRDEVSFLSAGANYGWDEVRGGPDDPDYGDYGDAESYAPPVVNTGPDVTWAPSGIAWYGADAISAWEDRLFVCGLTSETLFAVAFHDADEAPELEAGVAYDADWLDDRAAATAQPFYTGEFGRLRTVSVGSDGALYLLTSNRDGRADGDAREGDDRIVRLERT